MAGIRQENEEVWVGVGDLAFVKPNVACHSEKLDLEKSP